MTQTAERISHLKLPSALLPATELSLLLANLAEPPKLPCKLEPYQTVRSLNSEYQNLVLEIKLHILALLAVPTDMETYQRLQLLFKFFEHIHEVDTNYDASLNAIRFDILTAISKGETSVTIPVYAFTIFCLPHNLNNNSVAVSYLEDIMRKLKTIPNFLFPGIHVEEVKKIINPNTNLDTDPRWLLQIHFKEVPLNGD